MKLYFSPGACSLSPHIVANELGLALTLVKVNLQNKTTEDGKDFTQINPNGFVPVLELDDGRILTEGVAIVQYLAELKPEKNLAQKAGTFERAVVQEWLNYIATELHKSFGPLFNAASSDSDKKAAKEKISNRLALVEKSLAEKPFIAASSFTVADAYLFTILGWCNYAQIDLSNYPYITKYIKEIAERDSVKKALADEAK